HHHFLRVNLVEGAAASDEVGGRVDVRAPLADVTELLCEESGSAGSRLRVVPIQCPDALFVEPLPMRDVGRKTVGEIDELLARDCGIRLRKRRRLGLWFRFTHGYEYERRYGQDGRDRSESPDHG